MNPTHIPPGFYLATCPGARAQVVEHVCPILGHPGVSHWRNAQDDRIGFDPRSVGYTLVPIDSILCSGLTSYPPATTSKDVGNVEGVGPFQYPDGTYRQGPVRFAPPLPEKFCGLQSAPDFPPCKRPHDHSGPCAH